MLESIIADKVIALREEELGEAARTLLLRNLMDSYAGICASLLDVPLIQKFKRYADATPDAQGIRVWGAGRRAQAVHAVFMNTILGRRSDLVNTYLSPNHMGANHPSENVSLLLTLADWRSMTGEDFLRAMHLAYTLSCAFSDYCEPESAGFDHDAASALYIGLICGHVLGLDREQLVQTQRMAGVMGLNINQAAEGAVTDWKHCTYASCAMRGLSAAIMAAAGFEGPEEIYQGEAGINRFLPHTDAFFATRPDLERVVFKRWQALVFCQTTIDTALALHDQFLALDLNQVQQVEIWTYKKALEEAGTPGSMHPNSRAGRTHSLAYCAAAALLHGTINYESFSDTTSQEDALQRLMGKTTLYEDPAMTAAYPGSSPCRIRVSVEGQPALEARLDFPKGDPSDPLSNEEIEEKALEYLSGLASPQEAQTIVKRMWRIDREDSLDWLVNPLANEVKNP